MFFLNLSPGTYFNQHLIQRSFEGGDTQLNVTMMDHGQSLRPNSGPQNNLY